MNLRWTPGFSPEHPAGHGPVEWDLDVAGDTITAARPLIYPMHRGAEKLFESRDYRQAMMLANRHDWHSAFGSELGLALTIEAMLGIAVPERATWIRTLVAELSRAIHHLRWLGESARELENEQLAESAKRARETLIERHEDLTGGRMHPMVVAPGGLRADIPADWIRNVGVAVGTAREPTAELRRWVEECDALVDVCALSRADAIAYGASGALARASGLEIDLRFDDVYCNYRELIDAGALVRVGRPQGDAAARFQVLAGELTVSLDCIDVCADRLGQLPAGPVSVRLPRSLRLPEGAGYGWAETPTGINGWYVISCGGTEPYRLKIRSASFNNAQAFAAATRGTSVAAFPVAVMSALIVAGDLAK